MPAFVQVLGSCTTGRTITLTAAPTLGNRVIVVIVSGYSIAVGDYVIADSAANVWHTDNGRGRSSAFGNATQYQHVWSTKVANALSVGSTITLGLTAGMTFVAVAFEVSDAAAATYTYTEPSIPTFTYGSHVAAAVAGSSDSSSPYSLVASAPYEFDRLILGVISVARPNGAAVETIGSLNSPAWVNVAALASTHAGAVEQQTLRVYYQIITPASTAVHTWISAALSQNYNNIASLLVYRDEANETDNTTPERLPAFVRVAGMQTGANSGGPFTFTFGVTVPAGAFLVAGGDIGSAVTFTDSRGNLWRRDGGNQYDTNTSVDLYSCYVTVPIQVGDTFTFGGLWCGVLEFSGVSSLDKYTTPAEADDRLSEIMGGDPRYYATDRVGDLTNQTFLSAREAFPIHAKTLEVAIVALVVPVAYGSQGFTPATGWATAATGGPITNYTLSLNLYYFCYRVTTARQRVRFAAIIAPTRPIWSIQYNTYRGAGGAGGVTLAETANRWIHRAYVDSSNLKADRWTGGAAFEAAVIVSADPDAAAAPWLCVAANDDLFLLYHDTGGDTQVYRSDDYGASWASWATHAGLTYPCAVMTPAGMVLAGCVGDTLHFYASDNFGVTLTEITGLALTLGVQEGPFALRLDRNHFLHVVYSDGTSILHRWSRDHATWDTALAETLEAGTTPGYDVGLEMGFLTHWDAGTLEAESTDPDYGLALTVAPAPPAGASSAYEEQALGVLWDAGEGLWVSGRDDAGAVVANWSRSGGQTWDEVL
jgi:hypothetical protein